MRIALPYCRPTSLPSLGAATLVLLLGCSRPGPPGPSTEPVIAATSSTAASPRPVRRRARSRAHLPAASDAGDSPEARLARDRLVRSIETDGNPWEGSGPWDPRVLEAMRSVARHRFMPGSPLRRAYMDTPAPIGHGQTISQPTMVAIMSQALSLHGTERVLEIGTGSGYQAAILSVLAREVFTIEIIPALGETAKSRLAALGYRNVEVRIGDGYKGWPERAPFERILLTAAPPEIPKALVDQLAEGGILVAPVGDVPPQRLVRWTRVRGALKKEDLGAVRFVPMVREEDRDPRIE
jgi:protein-L-isoaspartate(D-aspartate) O-methyltransferase